MNQTSLGGGLYEFKTRLCRWGSSHSSLIRADLLQSSGDQGRHYDRSAAQWADRRLISVAFLAAYEKHKWLLFDILYFDFIQKHPMSTKVK